MSNPHLLPVPDMDQWSIDQVLAVFDLCQTICATLMQEHEDELIQRMIDVDQRSSNPTCDKTPPLPFDDPF